MRFLGFVVVTGAAMLLGACGGDKAPATQETPAVDTPAMEAPSAAPVAGGAITGTIHIINMVGDDKGFRYEPNQITAKAGDGIKFAMISGGPHNVAFDATLLSANMKAQFVANMPNQAAELMGPMMMNAGEDYTLSLAGIAPGTYEFFCTPHLAMGMNGKITITQ